METFKFDASTKSKKSAFCLSCKRRIDFESSHINNLELDMDCGNISVDHVYFESMEPFYNIVCGCGKDMIIVDRCVADLMEEFMNNDILKKHIRISVQCGKPLSKSITSAGKMYTDSYKCSESRITFSVKPLSLSVNLISDLLNKVIGFIGKYEGSFERYINDNCSDRDLKSALEYNLTIDFKSKENLVLFKNYILDFLNQN